MNEPTDQNRNDTPSPASPASAAPQSVGEDRIRTRAYELYEKRAGQPGDAESDWYRAEAELTNRQEKGKS